MNLSGAHGFTSGFSEVLAQQPKDKNKIYSLHEPDVYVIAKGKDHKQYEYDNKVSIVSTKDNRLCVGSLRCNPLMSLLAIVLRRVKAFLALARFLTWRKWRILALKVLILFLK
jgi:hypothetical protein